MLATVLAVLAVFLALPPPPSLSLQVLSEPSGAEVFIDGKPVGTTPVQVRLERHAGRGHVRLVHPSATRWEWSGDFPSSGRLTLHPRLQRAFRANERGLIAP